MLSGKDAFELYDTFGFPSDLTALIAGERGIKVDKRSLIKSFKPKSTVHVKTEKFRRMTGLSVNPCEEVEFVGYDNTSHSCKIARYRKVSSKGEDLYQVVLDTTPFYPEGGGQVGDTGTLSSGSNSVEVIDTKKENKLIVHTLKEFLKIYQPLSKLKLTLRPTLFSKKPLSNTPSTRKPRSILGTHVEQKGSLIRPENLRFDFSHFERVDSETLASIEEDVNNKILANISLDERRSIPLEQAQAEGAMMLFGEKYGDSVRMIGFGTSKELCGGIHVPATGSIGLFRIVSESSVASGIGRIEAVTGAAAYQASLKDRNDLESIGSNFKGAKDLVKAVNDLQKNLADLSKEVEGLRRKEAGNVKDDLVKAMKEVNGVNFLAVELNLDAKSVKDLAFQLKAENAPFWAYSQSRTALK